MTFDSKTFSVHIVYFNYSKTIFSNYDEKFNLEDIFSKQILIHTSKNEFDQGGLYSIWLIFLFIFKIKKILDEDQKYYKYKGLNFNHTFDDLYQSFNEKFLLYLNHLKFSKFLFDIEKIFK